MSLLLIMFAVASTANPGRMATASPPGSDSGGRAIGGGASLLLAVSILLGWVSGPLIGWIGVTESTAIIAAGIAVVVIGARDTFLAPPEVDAGESWRERAVFPLFFPTMFTPAMALIAVAAGSDRGVSIMFGAFAIGLSISVAVSMFAARARQPGGARFRRLLASTFGLWAVMAGAMIAVNGVTSI